MARLTEEQIAALRPAIVGVPEARPARFYYPRPRRRVGADAEAAGAFADQEGAPVPTHSGAPSVVTRLWPFALSWSAINEMAVVVSPRFSGPACIDRGMIAHNLANANPAALWQFVIADDGNGQGSDQTHAILAGSPVFERAGWAQDAGAAQPAGDGVFVLGGASSTLFREWVLGKVVVKSAFYLKMAFTNRVAVGGSLTGWVRVLENLPPDFVPR